MKARFAKLDWRAYQPAIGLARYRPIRCRSGMYQKKRRGKKQETRKEGRREEGQGLRVKPYPQQSACECARERERGRRERASGNLRETGNAYQWRCKGGMGLLPKPRGVFLTEPGIIKWEESLIEQSASILSNRATILIPHQFLSVSPKPG